MEDTTGLGPFTLKSARLEILVTTLEKEVISNELLAVVLSHVSKGEVLTLKLTVEG